MPCRWNNRLLSAWWKLITVRTVLNHSPDIRQYCKYVTKSYLNRPSVLSDFGCWVSTWSTSLLLDMKGDLTTSYAKSVGLIAPFTKRTGSLGLKEKFIFMRHKWHFSNWSWLWSYRVFNNLILMRLEVFFSANKILCVWSCFIEHWIAIEIFEFRTKLSPNTLRFDSFANG